MEAHYVIKQPILTEKSTFAMNEKGQYSFLVDPRATKDQIKKAIQDLYKVKVIRVNTQVRKGKFRRMRTGLTQESTTKKATVRLAEGQAIELF
jgi:large subunit ribosomal protein L23